MIRRPWFSLLLLAAQAALAHEGGVRDQKPTKAEPNLKASAKKLREAKKKLTASGAYKCCVRPGCNLCLRAKGRCECAANAAAGKGVCGECVAGWRAGRGAVRGVKPGAVCHRPVQTASTPPPTDPDVKAANEDLLKAKRILVKEKRYFCCMRGGCGQCAHEADCPCGSDLAKDIKAKGKNGQRRGVCGDCYDAWRGGLGTFPSVKPEEVMLSSMDAMTASMSPDSSPSSGWFVSGTALAPRASPFPMLHTNYKNWSLMLQGVIFAVQTNQTGPRGRDKFFAPNWIMPMASRRLGPGTLTIRSMFSLDPATVTNGRYPLLFQEGELYKGIPILNGQHPHDFVMELAASYQIRLSDRATVYVYGGPRGEPALGPAAFPHRASQSENPVAVLGHHFQDSTHIADNVVSAGVSYGPVTVEASGFHGREPDDRRWNIDGGAIDSLSGRVTVSPTPRWTAQFSIGRINNRENSHPLRDAFRQTASVSYVRPTATGHWATSLVWGRNHDLAFTQLPQLRPPASAAVQSVVQSSLFGVSALSDFGSVWPVPVARPFHIVQVPTRIPGQIYNSYLAETTLLWKRKNWFWARAESVDKDSLLLFPEEPFVTLVEEQRYTRVQSFTLGYARELKSPLKYLRPALGSQITIYRSPANLAEIYGSHPLGIQVFFRMRLGQPVQ